MHAARTTSWSWLPLAVSLGATSVFCVDLRAVAGMTQPAGVQLADSIHAEFTGQFRKTAAGSADTGFHIEANGVRWEVDVSAATILRQQAERLDGQRAMVRGTFAQQKEATRLRRVLTAASLDPARQDRDDQIDVTIVGTLKTGVMAIGAESTGVTITANGVTWDLEIERRHRDVVGSLNAARATVSGRLEYPGGVEVANRVVVKVRTVKGG